MLLLLMSLGAGADPVGAGVEDARWELMNFGVAFSIERGSCGDGFCGEKRKREAIGE